MNTILIFSKNILFKTAVLFIFILLLKTQIYSDEILIKENFSNSSINNWEIIDEGTTSSPSKWIIKNNLMQQDSNIYSNNKKSYPGTMAVTGNKKWKNYIFELNLRSTDDDAIGAVFRYIDQNNYYRLRLMGTDRSNNEGQVLEKVVNGKWTKLAFNQDKYKDSNWHRIRIIINKNKIIVYHDNIDEPIFDIIDKESNLNNGKIGLYSWGNTKSYFDNIKVTSALLIAEFNIKTRIIPKNKPVNLSLYINNFSEKYEKLSIKTFDSISLKSSNEINIASGEIKKLDISIIGNNLSHGKLQLLKNNSIIEEIIFLVVNDVNFLPVFADFHMHTTYSDGNHTPFEMVIKSRKVGLDAIAITDHGTTAGSRAGIRFIEQYRPNMIVITGEENTFDFPDTHTLGINLPIEMNHLRNECPSDLKKDRRKIYEWAENKGIMIFQAHPVWKNHKGSQEEKLAVVKERIDKKYITGIELINEKPDASINDGMVEFYYDLLKKGYKIPILGNSDAHSTGSLGKVRTLIFTDEYSSKGILNAVKESKTVIMDSKGTVIIGPKEYVDIAKIVIEDFLTIHDSLAEKEAKLLYLYHGGHIEKKEELEKLKSEWEKLYKEYFPYYTD